MAFIHPAPRVRAFGPTRRPARSTRVAWAGLGLAAASLPTTAQTAWSATLAGSLPAAATETVLLAVDCTNDGAGAPASLTVQVRDLAPVAAAVVSVQARKGFAAKSSTDAIDGDATASPAVAINEGAGRYDVYVDKNLAGEEPFEVTAQCWTGANGTGVATGTTLFAAAGGAVPSASPFAHFLLLGLLVAAATIGLRGGRRLLGMGSSRVGSLLLPTVFVGLGIGMTIAPAARAHSQSGSLGVAASATDYYEVTCIGNDNGSLEIQIRDASPGSAPFVSVQAHSGLSLRSVSDDLAADILPSAKIYSNEGAVVYNVLVDKSGPGAKFYDLTYHCWTGPNGTGAHSSSNLVTRQSE